MFRFISDFIKSQINQLDERWFVHQNAFKGHLWLMAILIILVLVRLLLNFIPNSTHDLSIEDSRILDSLKMAMQVNPILETETKHLFSFDPNYISKDSLDLLPLNRHFTTNLVKYREAGGKFYEISDLEKIYGYEQGEISALLSYIYFSTPGAKQVASKSKFSKRNNEYTEKPFDDPAQENETDIRNPPEPIDINKATAQELRQIPGIGPVFSERIIKYRELLGGYVDLNQLGEVYGLPESAKESLQKSTFVQKQFQPGKININEAGFKELLRHPYIDYKLAKKIDSARLYENGGLSKEKFREILNQSDSTILTVFPYLEF